MRCVFDTDVVVAALRSDAGASRRLLVSALRGEIAMLVSVPLMMEYEAVLTRPEHLSASGATAATVNRILNGLATILVPVELHFLWRPRLQDPADEMVLETAVNGRADALVTFNVRHLRRAAEEFNVRVLRPREAWKEFTDAKK